MLISQDPWTKQTHKQENTNSQEEHTGDSQLHLVRVKSVLILIDVETG